jgi:tetratricopeptide (TPR) repeat protein
MLLILGCGLLFLGGGLFLMHRLSGRDDQRMFDASGRWAITGVLAAVVVLVGKMAAGGGLAGAVIGLVAMIPAMVILSIIWVPSIVDTALSGLTGALTGGKEEAEPRPFYFRARAHRKKGELSVALAEIDAELEKFPKDWEGTSLKAEILFQEQKDARAALGVLVSFEAQPELPTAALNNSRFLRAELLQNTLLDLGEAIAVLESIVQDGPDSEAGRIARQRIAHMAAPRGSGEPVAPIAMVRHQERIGLMKDLGASMKLESDPQEEARDLVQKLEQHPLDWESRERLALLYAESFQKTSLAVLELRTLVEGPNQPDRRVVAWLNRIADIHLQSGESGLQWAKEALEEVLTRYPGSTWAEQASQRLALLGRSARAKTPTATLKLGVYEQNIGLKSTPVLDPNPDRNNP